MSEFQQRLQQAIDADYRIERELGGGGMSRVFVATERALQRKVVIKVLPPELAAGVNIERFRREIQLAAQLQHPHIVPLLATGDQDGILWFSMPFIEGESLRAALTKHERLAPRDVVRILHDVVDALAYAHARGVVHRDIKPDNILTSGMHALVTDFGVAKALSAAIPLAGGTTTGMAIGTPAYMAPEQLAADPAADHRVDIYAVGLLAYELLTGHSPFTGSSPQATMAAQLTEVPKPPSQFADIPEALSAVIMHCLEKDAAKRPASAQALLAELEALPPVGSGQSVAMRRPRRRLMTVAAAVAVLAAVMVVAQQLRKPTSTTAVVSDTLSARDIGAGGYRTARAILGRNGTDMALAEPETVVVYRSSADSAQGFSVPVVISRAESLSIAAAIQRRHDAASPRIPAPAVPNLAASEKAMSGMVVPKIPDPKAQRTVLIDQDMLVEEVKKLFADSMARAFSRMDTALARVARTNRFEITRPPDRVTPIMAPPSDGRMRIVVSNFSNTTGKREFSSVGRDAARFLRSALPSDKFDVIDSEATDRAMRSFADPMSLGWALRADYVVSGMVMQRADSVVLLTIFTDTKNGWYSRANEVAAPSSDPSMAFDPAYSQVSAWLDTARTIRSRRPSGPQRRPDNRSEPGGRNGRSELNVRPPSL